MKPSINNSNLEKIFKKANNFFYSGKFENVIKVLEKIIDDVNNIDMLLMYYKASIIVKDNCDSVIKYLIKALDSEPDNLDILYEILLYYFNKKDIDNFNIYCDKMLKIQNNIDISLLYLKKKNIDFNKIKIEYFLKKNIEYFFKKNIESLDLENPSSIHKYLILKKLNIFDSYFLYDDKKEFWDYFFISRSRNLQEDEINLLIFLTYIPLIPTKSDFDENMLIQDYIENIKGKDYLLLKIARSQLLSKISYENTIQDIKDILSNNNEYIDNEYKIICLKKYLAVFHYKEVYNNEYKMYLKNFSKIIDKDNKYNFFLNKKNKKIRIGYISPDLRLHSVKFFLAPIYRFHDKKKFEIFSYYTNDISDIHTEFFKNNSNKWRKIVNIRDEEIADIIYNDRIDILVDLSGFTHKSKLNVFSYKPAPVQISMIGYNGSTGLETVDYKILDKYLSDGMDEYFIEKIINIPDTLFCYESDKNIPAIKELPYLRNGYLTFGIFNNGLKITEKSVELWSKILNYYKDSKIIIKCKQVEYKIFKEKIIKLFKKFEIASERISFIDFTEKIFNHLDYYNMIDVSLDTYPYNGVTTTFESLIMGVPVLSFSGKSVVARVGVSILSNLNLDNWVVEENNKNNIVIDLSNLEYLRKNLREKLLSSVLCDHKGFTLKLENIYRQILRR